MISAFRFITVVCRGSTSRSNLVRRHTFQFLQQVHIIVTIINSSSSSSFTTTTTNTNIIKITITKVIIMFFFSLQILHVWPLHKLEGLGAEVGAAVSLIKMITIITICKGLVIEMVAVQMIPMTTITG